MTPSPTATSTFTPGPTATFTRTPTVTPFPLPTRSPYCWQRPPMTILTQPDGTGQVKVSLQVSSSAGVPDNIVQYFRVVGLSNAAVDLDGYHISTPSGMLTMADDTRSITFVVERQVRRNAFWATFEIWDICGAWQSFAGGGPAQP